MKGGKAVWIISGSILFLFAMCGVVYFCEFWGNEYNSQLDKMPSGNWIGQKETQSRKLDKAAFAQKVKKLQMPFIANHGQTDERVKFYAKTFGGTVFVTDEGEIVYSLPYSASDSKSERTGIALREEIIGAKANVVQGEAKTITKVNYFKGSDPSKWKRNISTYEVVNFGEVYNGIGLRLKAYGDNVEKLFCIEPGSHPGKIRVRLIGARSAWVDTNGQLEVETELGPVKFTKPIAYQEIDGKRVEVGVEYDIYDARETIQDKNSTSVMYHGPYIENHNLNQKPEIQNPRCEYGFKVASYDHTKDLIIDPMLASTYLGGFNNESCYSLAIDASGNVYVAGYTNSVDFPVASGVYDAYFNGDNDVFISKLDSELTNLLASTYLGGLDSEFGNVLILDAIGNVYVTGSTNSEDFPVTNGAYNTNFNSGSKDIFVSKLNSELTNLLASTYLGGSEDDGSAALTLDASGNVYITGSTGSEDFPVTNSAFDTSFNGVDGTYDVFVSKLNSELTNLLASTYLGGSEDDDSAAFALDASGNVYITGSTDSKDFPVTSSAFDTSSNGIYDVFVSKLNSELTNLLASTYLGGSDRSQSGAALTLDAGVNVYVMGQTSSVDFPVTDNAYDTHFNGDDDIFISKLDSELTNLLASTYLGGLREDDGRAFTLDVNGNVYMTGRTQSEDFPVTSGAYNTYFNGSRDVYVSKLDSELTNLLASTYLGGSDWEAGEALVLDASGNVYVTGYTRSEDFPVTNDVYNTSHNGSYDIFISKLDGDLSADVVLPSPSPTPIFTLPPLPTLIPPIQTPLPTPVFTLPPFPTPTPPVQTEKGVIYGFVIDAIGKPIEGAKVTLKGKKVKGEKITDLIGFFGFDNLDASMYRVIVKKKGYKITRKRIKLEKGEEKKLMITIKTKS